MPLRNFAPRRQHKERSQPTHRSKFGLLEKHKDYVLRAADHHSKRDRINRLKQKVLEKNEDEFYFGMVKSRMVKGVHYQPGDEDKSTPLPASIVALMKSQDLGYVRRQIIAETKRVERLKEEIAPLVPEMKVEWLEDRPARIQALKEVGLLGEQFTKGGKNKSKASSLDLNGDRGDGKVGSQGKRTVWLDDVDQVRQYSTPSSSSSSSSAAASSSRRPHNQDPDEEGQGEGDYDLTDLPTDLHPSPHHNSSSSSSSSSLSKSSKSNKHASYLLSLLSSRLIRLSTLTSTASRLSLTASLMKGSKGQSSRRVSQEKGKALEAVMRGKMTKNGLALPGNEADDDEEGDEKINGKKSKKGKLVYKWSKERKR